MLVKGGTHTFWCVVEGCFFVLSLYFCRKETSLGMHRLSVFCFLLWVLCACVGS